MSIFYQDDLIIYALSFNGFIPFNVNNDVLAKVRKNFFEHNRRQNDKIIQNYNTDTIKYTYNLEKSKPMKWVVQKNKQIIEKAVNASVNSYEIRTYNNSGEVIISTEYTNSHLIKKSTFAVDGSTVVVSVGNENNQPTLYYRGNNVNTKLNLLEIRENGEVLKELYEKNPFITVTALTNRGIVYFGTDEEIENVNSVIEEIKEEIKIKNSPIVYNTPEDRKTGFNFKDNDFNLKRNMNETYDISKSAYFDFDDESAEFDDIPEINPHDINLDLDIDGEEDNSLEEISALESENIVSDVQLNEPEVTANADEKIEEIVNERIAPEEKIITPENTATQEVTGNIQQTVVAESLVGKEDSVVTEDEQNLNEQSQAENAENINVAESETVGETTDTTAEISDDTKVAPDFTSEEVLRELLSEALLKATKATPNAVDISGGETPVDEPDYPNETTTIADLIINSDGERYLYYGDVKNNCVRDGYGRTEMENGKTAYEGHYKDNKRNGFGSFYFKNGGLSYTGNWKDNKRQGFGVGFRSSDGSYHTGKWKDNKPEGIGARFDKYGNLSYVSNFKNGKETGLCIEFRQDGGITIFRFVNDSKKIIQTIYP